jgi:hypothetical protein
MKEARLALGFRNSKSCVGHGEKLGGGRRWGANKKQLI